MTESDWWAETDDTNLLLEWLVRWAKPANRKRMLFALACCRRVIPHLSDARFRGWAAVVEFLTGERARNAGIDAVPTASAFLELSKGQFPDAESWAGCGSFRDTHLGWFGVSVAAREAVYASKHPDRRPACDWAESEAHCALLHDIFGPLPFRNVTVEPWWLTSDVLALAQGIYDDNAFDRMPILADALQDAGCTDDDVLTHCRAEGWEHVRGCWLVDLLLDRPWREP